MHACTQRTHARTHARLQAVASYQEFSGRQNIFVEYVLLAGVNDGAPDACLAPPSLCGLLLVARRGPGAWIACACQCWGQCSRLLAIRPHSCPSPEAVRLCASPVAGVQHAHELGTLLRGLKVLLNLIPWVSGGLVGLCGCGGRLCLVAWVGGGRKGQRSARSASFTLTSSPPTGGRGGRLQLQSRPPLYRSSPPYIYGRRTRCLRQRRRTTTAPPPRRPSMPSRWGLEGMARCCAAAQSISRAANALPHPGRSVCLYAPRRRV